VPTKPWYLSKGVWTGIGGVLVSLYLAVKLFLVPTLPDIPEFVLTLLGSLGITFLRTAKTTIIK
jgi:hypothetical protein